jgi:hypothetical protein
MTDRRFIDELIRAVNEYRAVHQVEPLRHNAVISTISQSWSDRLARSGSMEHNPNRSYNGQPLGENIAMKWSSDRADYTGQSNQRIVSHHLCQRAVADGQCECFVVFKETVNWVRLQFGLDI